MWVEKEGAYGNAERRTQFWHQLVDRAGRVALRPVAADGVLQALQDRGGLAGRADRQEARVPRQDAVRRAVRQRPGRQVPADRHRSRLRQRRSRRPSASTCRRACSRNTPSSAAAMATTWRRSTPTTRCAACAGRWSTARKPCGATARAPTPTSRPGEGVQFYGNPDGKARDLRAALRAGGRSRPTRNIRLLAVHRPRAGALALRLMTRRVPELLQGVPEARCASCTPTTPPALRLRRGDEVKVQSRRGEMRTRRRDPRPQQDAARPGLRALVRRQRSSSTR